MDPVLTGITFSRGIPRRSVAPAVEKIDRTRPLLVVGSLPGDAKADVEHAGVEIVRVTSVLHALENMASIAFRAVAIAPEIDGAIDLVKQVKLGFGASDVEHVWEAASRNQLTPIIVLPFAGDDEYAVIVLPPKVAFLERTRELPLSHALLRLDVESLVYRQRRN